MRGSRARIPAASPRPAFRFWKVTKKTLEGLRKGMLRFEEELGGKGKPGKADKKSAERKKVQTLPEVAKRSVSLDFLLRFTEANDCWGWTTVEVTRPPAERSRPPATRITPSNPSPSGTLSPRPTLSASCS